jgi:hypothetical protein
MSSDFLTVDGSRERISCRIPLTRTADPSVAATGSGHSLINSGSSLSFFFIFILDMLQQMGSERPAVNGIRADSSREMEPLRLWERPLFPRRHRAIFRFARTAFWGTVPV